MNKYIQGFNAFVILLVIGICLYLGYLYEESQPSLYAIPRGRIIIRGGTPDYEEET